MTGTTDTHNDDPTTNEPPTRSWDDWSTVSFQPLPPGWVNEYTHNDEPSFIIKPCPGVLIQEHRLTHTSWSETGPDGRARFLSRSTPEDPPYETRAVFADYDGVDLDEADVCSNYVGTRWAPNETANTP